MKAANVLEREFEAGSPWENSYVESFNARLRDELLNREIFYSLKEAQIIIEGWRKHCNTKRPHSALGYRPPAPESIIPIDQRPAMHLQSSWTSQVRPLRLLFLAVSGFKWPLAEEWQIVGAG